MAGTRHSLDTVNKRHDVMQILHQSYVLHKFLFVKHVKTVKLNWDV